MAVLVVVHALLGNGLRHVQRDICCGAFIAEIATIYGTNPFLGNSATISQLARHEDNSSCTIATNDQMSVALWVPIVVLHAGNPVFENSVNDARACWATQTGTSCLEWRKQFCSRCLAHSHQTMAISHAFARITLSKGKA